MLRGLYLLSNASFYICHHYLFKVGVDSLHRSELMLVHDKYQIFISFFSGSTTSYLNHWLRESAARFYGDRIAIFQRACNSFAVMSLSSSVSLLFKCLSPSTPAPAPAHWTLIPICKLIYLHL